jgi:hypothetical protein
MTADHSRVDLALVREVRAVPAWHWKPAEAQVLQFV